MKLRPCLTGIACLLTWWTASLSAQERVAPYRDAGTINIHAAAGTSNGIRAGFRYHVFPELALECSAGFLELKDTRQTDNPARADAYAIGIGVNFFSQPANDFSGLVSLLVTRDNAYERIGDLLPRRWALTLGFGADYQFTRMFMCFFRIGPSVHFLSKEEIGEAQLFLHIDGGVGITL